MALRYVFKVLVSVVLVLLCVLQYVFLVRGSLAFLGSPELSYAPILGFAWVGSFIVVPMIVRNLREWWR